MLFIMILAVLFIAGLYLQGGKLAKSIELLEGITINVPRNFPKVTLKEEQGLKILSFNLQPHKNSSRFVHFFEVISSPAKIDTFAAHKLSPSGLGKEVPLSINPETSSSLQTRESRRVDFLKRIPQESYKLGKSDKESILINGQNINLETIDLEITHPCGSKQKTQLYVAECCCDNKEKYVYILTFTMTKKGFLEIVKTLKCH